MEHQFVDLGQRPSGTVVEFHVVGNAANVWLMDASAYSRYKQGYEVRAVGGTYDKEPNSAGGTQQRPLVRGSRSWRIPRSSWVEDGRASWPSSPDS